MKPSASQLINPDLRYLHDKFTEIIANRLYFFDSVKAVDLSKTTYDEVIAMQSGSIGRYQNDLSFRAKVDNIVASLVMVTQEETETRTSKIAEQFGGIFKITEV